MKTLRVIVAVVAMIAIMGCATVKVNPPVNTTDTVTIKLGKTTKISVVVPKGLTTANKRIQLIPAGKVLGIRFNAIDNNCDAWGVFVVKTVDKKIIPIALVVMDKDDPNCKVKASYVYHKGMPVPATMDAVIKTLDLYMKAKVQGV